MKNLDIIIDFDGTVVKHEFPKIGGDIGSVPVLKELVAAGHNLILFTMRSDKPDNTGTSREVPEVHNGQFLTDAVNWFKQHDIPLYGIQTNPTQHKWTTSPKAYGQIMLDDSSLQAPLKRDYCPEAIKGLCIDDYCKTCGGFGLVGRPYYDWEKAREILVNMGVLE